MTTLRSNVHSVRGRSGTTFVAVLVALVAIAGFSTLCLSTTTAAVKRTEEEARDRRLEMAATSAASLVAGSIWNSFMATSGGKAGTLSAFRTYLDSSNNALGMPLRDATSTTADVSIDGLSVSGLPRDSKNTTRLGGIAVTNASLVRRDASAETNLEITVTARSGDLASTSARTVRQTFTVGGGLFAGLGYALLSNNVNCIMCHARLDRTDRYYNVDSNLYGTYDRIRVGTLDALLVRLGSADSQLAGTLYVRGTITDAKGNPLNDLVGTSVTGNDFDSIGKLLQDSSGLMSKVDLANTTGSPLPAFGHLYKDYPTDPTLMTDGELPSSFPAPIPDLDGDKLVDKAEFDAAAAGVTGSVSGGTIYEVADGSTYSGALPSSGNTTKVTGISDKNLILLGDSTNPIQINGTIAVDGDVVLQGTVKGNGVIVASGNIYVLGDLTYADGTVNGSRTYGVGADGALNGLALAAGRNLVIGDYVRASNGSMVTGDGVGSFNFSMSEIALFNRTEWTRTRTKLPDAGGNPVDNPLYVPGYKPRYYTHGPGDPVYIQNKSSTGKSGYYFDAATRTWKGKEHVSDYDLNYLNSYKAGSTTYDSATLIDLGPRNGWLSESTLVNFWKAVDGKHQPGPMEIDAFLYTNNSAWALVRSTSAYAGQMLLNGAVVAADTGILVPGNGGVGLQLNFDGRPGANLPIRDTSGASTLRAGLWLPMPVCAH